tara:strand:+ start:2857 stop:3015 length:159 start_codon:yes stop_codon:yes gene_type:complete
MSTTFSDPGDDFFELIHSEWLLRAKDPDDHSEFSLWMKTFLDLWEHGNPENN